MAFSFDSISATVSSKRLTPWNIHHVKFDGCKIEHIQGKKDPSKVYNILKTRFSNEHGYYEESTFFPETADDAKRPEYKSKDGSTGVMPSHQENAMYFIAQLLNTLKPEAYNKLKEVSPKCKDFKDIAEVVVKLTTPLKGTETNLKLVGRTRDGYVNAALPNFVAIGKEPNDKGVYPAYMSDKFIGDNLEFSAYELTKKKEAEAAAPTDMANTVEETKDTSLDLDNLI